MIVFGIETTCDETSVSIVEKKKNKEFGDILVEETLSQIIKHKEFGGVVPELASREHSKNLDYLVKRSIKSSKINFNKIDAYAAATGPGLLGALLVGTNYAKALAVASNKPFISVNHLQGHVLVSRMNKKINFPFLCLIVSGGHCQIILAHNERKFKIIGESVDDAVGEVFDKTSNILGYGYPGGPIIEKLAKKKKKKFKFNLPKPLLKDKTFNLSFSGLKTAVRRIIESGLKKDEKYDLAYQFQEVITICLLEKVKRALKYYKKKYNINDFVLSGGVASNLFIRESFEQMCTKEEITFFAPESKLCVDNASMIAWAGIEMLRNGKIESKINLSPQPRWRIDRL